MKIYNEIYPAEGWANKILKYLGKVAEEKPNMYAKTKKRYENLAYSLLESVSLIVSILEEDSLVPSSTDEFNELDTSDQNKILQKLDALNNQLRRTDRFHSDGTYKSTISTSASSSPMSNSPGKIDNRERFNLGGFTYDQIFRYYDEVFEDASNLNFGYSEVNECARMLYQWFHARFMPEKKDVNFICQIKCLPEWIMSFILVYGKHLHDGKVHYFQESLDQWCEKIKSGVSGFYAIPFEVFRVNNDFKKGICNPEDYTLDAVIVNDILSNMCLYRLGKDEQNSPVCYDPGELANIVKDRNPALYTKVRSRIANRKDLIYEIGLTPVGGIEVDG